MSLGIPGRVWASPDGAKTGEHFTTAGLNVQRSGRDGKLRPEETPDSGLEVTRSVPRPWRAPQDGRRLKDLAKRLLVLHVPPEDTAQVAGRGTSALSVLGSP